MATTVTLDADIVRAVQQETREKRKARRCLPVRTAFRMLAAGGDRYAEGSGRAPGAGQSSRQRPPRADRME